MRRIDAYSQPTPPWTRIEMLIAAFDGTISRIEQARTLFERNEALKAHQQLIRAQRIVLELYSGIDVRHGQIPKNMQDLYLFVLNCIGLGPKLDLSAALDVLTTIRSGMDSIRETAAQMERQGQLSPIKDQTQLLQNIVA